MQLKELFLVSSNTHNGLLSRRHSQFACSLLHFLKKAILHVVRQMISPVLVQELLRALSARMG
jgi:hypothetical protein